MSVREQRKEQLQLIRACQFTARGNSGNLTLTMPWASLANRS